MLALAASVAKPWCFCYYTFDTLSWERRSDLSDNILVVGNSDEKLLAFLKKLGHQVKASEGAVGLEQALGASLFDLVLVDSRLGIDGLEVCSFFRDQEATKETPILWVGEDAEFEAGLTERGIEHVEVVPGPFHVGRVVSRISTALRLRKFRGSDTESASLAEMNAALRDLTDKFAKELEEARAIQQSLLPDSLPSDHRFDIAASYEPLEEVGGDWFYVQNTAGGKTSVLIGDVTGHGLQAAFIGSMTKLAMIAAAKELPHELLEEMNRLMAPNMPEGKFVTMFAYLYDPASGQLDYARAGHLPGFLLRKETGEVEELLGDGFAVGFFEDGMYTAESTIMNVGDVFVILTDGIPEGQNMSGETYGHERLAKCMKASSAQDSATIIQDIISDFESYREGRILKDDVTVIALRRSA